MSTETAVQTTVLPFTFNDLPWVTGIDKLPHVDWLRSNPDGIQLWRLVNGLDATPEAVDLVTAPIRNIVRLMLKSTAETVDLIAGGPYVGWMSLQEHLNALEFDLGRPNRDADVADAVREMKENFPGAPLTIAAFEEHLRAEAQYWDAYYLAYSQAW